MHGAAEVPTPPRCKARRGAGGEGRNLCSRNRRQTGAVRPPPPGTCCAPAGGSTCMPSGRGRRGGRHPSGPRWRPPGRAGVALGSVPRGRRGPRCGGGEGGRRGEGRGRDPRLGRPGAALAHAVRWHEAFGSAPTAHGAPQPRVAFARSGGVRAVARPPGRAPGPSLLATLGEAGARLSRALGAPRVVPRGALGPARAA